MLQIHFYRQIFIHSFKILQFKSLYFPLLYGFQLITNCFYFALYFNQISRFARDWTISGIRWSCSTSSCHRSRRKLARSVDFCLLLLELLNGLFFNKKTFQQERNIHLLIQIGSLWIPVF